MSVQVYRYAGDKGTDPVINPLLDEATLPFYGKYLMDCNAQPSSKIVAMISYRGGIKLGQLLSIPDPSTSSSYKAKVTGISIQFSNGQASQVLTLERPLPL